MLPPGITGLFCLKNGEICFYSVSICKNENKYLVIEKSGNIGVYFKEKKSTFLKYKSAYEFVELQIAKKIKLGYEMDPVDAIEIKSASDAEEINYNDDNSLHLSDLTSDTDTTLVN